ncbi:leucine carboxyl methyltransferase, putative [Plasmodium ovale curtisi]|uniref:Leucine carboxyl methyltransferase 1 n=1 Tax=Plasmodium ovale curtisi TaxID=864141 RepID=A0A1A8WZB1_PLAOA|nr:leucine carboxyl methyltransferase, putative [Plasmodium ovale curtisi]SBS97232.1 leucine carboxyl methyltransferase, putative [Plasmodium ovale curtisi]
MSSVDPSTRKVQSTTYEAASSKLLYLKENAKSGENILKKVEKKLGYYRDPFLKYFIKKIEKRSPLINRGYYSRVAALRQYIDLFFKSLNDERYKNVTYYEMDFYELLREKSSVINQVDELKKFLIYDEKTVDDWKKGDVINCVNYKMLSFDLNDWASIERNLTSYKFNFSLPTLFLCECVLIYLEIESSDNLIKKLAELMKNTACIIVYEQVNPSTAFGKIMIDNFNQRGIGLKSIYKYNSLDLQLMRYKSLGWLNVYINDMNEIYDYHLGEDEKKEIEKIEMFDEFEEWRLLQNHYFILVAFNCYTSRLDKLNDFLKRKKGRCVAT